MGECHTSCTVGTYGHCSLLSHCRPGLGAQDSCSVTASGCLHCDEAAMAFGKVILRGLMGKQGRGPQLQACATIVCGVSGSTWHGIS